MRDKTIPKLKRRDIISGLDSLPIETILLGKDNKELTHKQREFARAVALGETKAGAYRKAYDYKTKNKKTHGDIGYKLAKDPAIQTQIETFRAANEAAKYRTPAQLRDFIVHQLTIHAGNAEFPPASRIKCLELLGKLSDVGAFTERRESTVIHQSADIRQRLLETLKTIDITPKEIPNDDDADSLMRELSNVETLPVDNVVETLPVSEGGDPVEMLPGDQDGTGTPVFGRVTEGAALHSIPHDKISTKTNGGNVTRGEWGKEILEDGDEDV